MPYDAILYEVSDWIATITLNRPEKMNAWTLTMDSEYRDAIQNAQARNDVRVIIVTGMGRAFCAGADMGLLASAQEGSLEMTEEHVKAMAFGDDSARMDFRMPYSFPTSIGKPIIAAINGHAMGLGLVNALFCDIRIAGDQAKLSTLFARRGLIAEHGISWILPRIVGLGHALDLLLTGRTIDADEAYRLGLVSRVVPQDGLMAAARELATEIAVKSSPRSTRVIKRQVWESTVTGLAESTQNANKAMFESFSCCDFAEALGAFIQRRPPEFSGK